MVTEPIYDFKFNLSKFIENNYSNWIDFSKTIELPSNSNNMYGSLYGLRCIYYLFGSNEELLWIGYTSNLRSRLGAHVVSDTDKAVPYKEVYSVAVLFNDNVTKLRDSIPDCYDPEYYLIEKLNPKYNKARWNWRLSYKKTRPSWRYIGHEDL